MLLRMLRLSSALHTCLCTCTHTCKHIHLRKKGRGGVVKGERERYTKGLTENQGMLVRIRQEKKLCKVIRYNGEERPLSC